MANAASHHRSPLQPRLHHRLRQQQSQVRDRRTVPQLPLITLGDARVVGSRFIDTCGYWRANSAPTNLPHRTALASKDDAHSSSRANRRVRSSGCTQRVPDRHEQRPQTVSSLLPGMSAPHCAVARMS